MKSKRQALNRGTVVYLGGSRVEWIWPCGCKQKATVMIGPVRGKQPISPAVLAKLAPYWRRSGVGLPECKKHPGWYSKESQVARLNEENPQP